MGSRVGVGALRLVFLPSARPAARPAWPAWPAWIGLGMLVVLAIGFSRLALGVHYLPVRRPGRRVARGQRLAPGPRPT
jgi:hypothetical protein